MERCVEAQTGPVAEPAQDQFWAHLLTDQNGFNSRTILESRAEAATTSISLPQARLLFLLHERKSAYLEEHTCNGDWLAEEHAGHGAGEWPKLNGVLQEGPQRPLPKPLCPHIPSRQLSPHDGMQMISCL